MPRVSITVKYSLLILFSIVATSGGLSWFALDLLKNEVRDQLTHRGESIAQLLAYALSPVLLSKDDAKIQAVLNKVFEDPDIVAGSVLDAENKVVADRDAAAVSKPFDDVFVPLEKMRCDGMHEDLLGDRFVFMQTASFSGVQVGCVVISLSRASLGRAIEQASSRVLFLTALIALVVIALSFLTLRRTLRPLSKVIEGTKRIADGDFSTRLKIRTKDEIGDLAEAFDGMAARTELFFRYLDKSIADRLIHDETLAKPGGSLKQVSVLFGDMRGFTELSNERPPDEIVWVLNTYFDLFFQVVHHFSGVVDKTMGDAIMAFFEPFKSTDTSYSQRATMSAVAMRATLSAVAMRATVWVMQGVLDRTAEAGIPVRLEPCRFGFAVASGRLIVGNIGSSRHMDYTVCGPAVNLAARLQEDTRRGEIIVDRFTSLDVEDLVITRELQRVLPKGFGPSQEVTPYQVVGLAPSEVTDIRKLLRHLFDRRFWMKQVLAVAWENADIPVEQREEWGDFMHTQAMELIDLDPPVFLVE
jgi:adenylate cyclase